jgi:hypothetical protein
MAYISQIAIENALSAFEQPEPICNRQATEAALVLLANSPRHARRFALAMHGRVARGLDTDMIEHWARVVMEIARLTGMRRIAASSRV